MCVIFNKLSQGFMFYALKVLDLELFDLVLVKL